MSFSGHDVERRGTNRSWLVGIQISNGGEQQPAKATGSAVLPLACGPGTLGPLVMRSGERNGTAALAVPGLDLLAFRALGFEKGGGFLGTWARYAWFGRKWPIRQGVAGCVWSTVWEVWEPALVW